MLLVGCGIGRAWRPADWMFMGVIYSRRPVRRIGRQVLTERGARQRSPIGEVGSWRKAGASDRGDALGPAIPTYPVPARAKLPGRAHVAAEPAAEGSGAIDWRMLDDAGILDPRDPASPLATVFREIGAPLLARAPARDALPADRVVLVTSPAQGDGKTFVALNLALCLAQDPDRPILLIDANPSRPGARALLSLAPPAGLTDLLGEAGPDPAQLIVSTELPGLAILGPGAPRPDLADLLAGPSMASLLRALGAGDPRRLIIIDGPALGAGPEARILAGLAGQTLLVVDQQTPDEAVDAALDELRGDRPLFLLRNRSGRPEGGSVQLA